MKRYVKSSTSELNHFIWEYHFADPEDYNEFIATWEEMMYSEDACIIPMLPDKMPSVLAIHALIDESTGYYEQWAVADGEEYDHDVYHDIQYFPNEYNGNHPIADRFYDGAWHNNTSNLHQYS